MKPSFLMTAAAFLIAGAAHAADPVQQHNSNTIWFENWIGLSNASMRIASPEGDMFDIYAETGTPVFQLSGADIEDGIYRYELRAATEEMVKNRDRSQLSIEGEEAPEYIPKQLYRTGFFVVERGVIITPEYEEETQ